MCIYTYMYIMSSYTYVPFLHHLSPSNPIRSLRWPWNEKRTRKRKFDPGTFSHESHIGEGVKFVEVASCCSFEHHFAPRFVVQVSLGNMFECSQMICCLLVLDGLFIYKYIYIYLYIYGFGAFSGPPRFGSLVKCYWVIVSLNDQQVQYHPFAFSYCKSNWKKTRVIYWDFFHLNNCSEFKSTVFINTTDVYKHYIYIHTLKTKNTKITKKPNKPKKNKKNKQTKKNKKNKQTKKTKKKQCFPN